MKHDVERPRTVWRVETVLMVVREMTAVVKTVSRIALRGTFSLGCTRPMKVE
jgi:hypothetical protein